MIGAVIVSAWLFGSADPWAYLGVGLVVAVAAAAWLLRLVVRPVPRLRLPLAVVSLLALGGVMLIQVVPLPASLVRRLSPFAARVQQKRVEVFEEMHEAGADAFLLAGPVEDGGTAALSASAARTWRSLYLLVAYVAVFLVTANALENWRQVRMAAGALVVSGFAMSVLGMIHELSGSEKILWVYTPPFGGGIFGPFTNPNHYAAYMNMVFGVGLGLAFARVSGAADGAGRTLRDRIVWLSTGSGGRSALLVFALVMMPVSVCMSLSRGGIACLAVSLGVLGAWAAVRGGLGYRSILGAVALLVVGGVVWLGWEPVFAEMGTLAEIDPGTHSRTVVARSTLSIFSQAPVLGCGFGTFVHVFPPFQPPGVQFGRWLHAHNDYVQFLAEGGIVGALLLAAAAVIVLGHVWRRLREVHGSRRAFVSGLAVGLLAIGLHSALDYSLHKPGIALTLAAVCGLMVAALHVGSGTEKRAARTSRGGTV